MFDLSTGDSNMAFIFILMFVAVLFAWRGYRRTAVCCVILTLALGSLYFYHDITSHLNIQL
jgi:hypothetical protein